MDEMVEKEEVTQQEQQSEPAQEKKKSSWQQTKEGWYDKIPLTLKQLDIIIAVCLILLGLCFVAICLDAMDIVHFFG